ncbi:SOS response-associated peptidase family protein [Ralstonia insidiosa]|nr:SOS response-associated peptidase family protein [Ralstonia insidiosa]
MCTNYSPAKVERLRVLLGLGPPIEYPPETFPDYESPLILINKDDKQDCVVANFGFAPAEYAPAGMPNPVNARAETVATNRMCSKYWKACNLCIVPVDAIYEPCYESGRNVRHKIWIKGESEFGIAGIWRAWESPTGGPPRHTFAMLTLNAEPRHLQAHAQTDQPRWHSKGEARGGHAHARQVERLGGLPGPRGGAQLFVVVPS